MADVWELVIEHSTAPPGSDFWEHLSAQEGGGGGPSGYILADSYSFDVEDEVIEIEIEDSLIEIEISDEVEVEIEDSDIELEVENA